MIITNTKITSYRSFISHSMGNIFLVSHTLLLLILLIARFRVQHYQYFPSFSYFADLFHEPLGE